MSPTLYPVACFITGSGIWRDILWAHPLGLLRRDPPLPILTSALHFLDFRVHPPALARWRSQPLRARYRPHADWRGELFVDSGGLPTVALFVIICFSRRGGGGRPGSGENQAAQSETRTRPGRAGHPQRPYREFPGK